jgi:hypothetical protein
MGPRKVQAMRAQPLRVRRARVLDRNPLLFSRIAYAKMMVQSGLGVLEENALGDFCELEPLGACCVFVLPWFGTGEPYAPLSYPPGHRELPGD